MRTEPRASADEYKLLVELDRGATYNQGSSMALSAQPTPRMEDMRRPLLDWYDTHRRPLPWRENRNPYRVWVSEIMLQQTRVAAVVMRYESFLRQFSSLEELARAPQASVLAAWSGLGYYRRARNMHAAAKLVVRDLQGQLPRTAADWRALPGVGRYTAAAIASIAFNEPIAVVDGNVERVLGRFLAHSSRRSKMWQTAQEFLDRSRPGDFNQAMMELGATVCLPAMPRCRDCPIRIFCRSCGPAEGARRKYRRCRREVAYGLARKGDAVLLVKRDAAESLMPGMWELPEVPAAELSAPPLFTLTHAITVTDFRVHVIQTRVPGPGTWVRISRLSRVPLTGLTKKILRLARIID